jgi:hypothetical protein
LLADLHSIRHYDLKGRTSRITKINNRYWKEPGRNYLTKIPFVGFDDKNRDTIRVYTDEPEKQKMISQIGLRTDPKIARKWRNYPSISSYLTSLVTLLSNGYFLEQIGCGPNNLGAEVFNYFFVDPGRKK